MQDDISKILKAARARMEKTIDHFQAELTKIRAGKVSPDILNGILVNYYGNPTPIQQVANVNVVDARTLSVQPWEKNMLQEVEKAILAANIGITPQNDGQQIRLFMPPMTEEHRKELVKRAGAEAEQAKVSIRNERREAMDKVKKLQKEDNLSEDEAKGAEGNIQNVTDAFVTKIDTFMAAKEKQILTV